MQEYLKFSPGNAKIKDKGVAVFSIPAGYTCPAANECYAKFDRALNKVVDGPNLRFRCYAASQEARYPALRNLTDHNLRLLRNARSEARMAELLKISLPAGYFDKVRMHMDGDFYNITYMRAWLRVAEEQPWRLFYGYTKSVDLWEKLHDEIPDNVSLTASIGGKYDHIAVANGFRTATVVFHPKVAELNNWEIDEDETLAMAKEGPPFALLLHSTQPKGSEAAAAKRLMERTGVEFGYGKRTKINHKPPGE